MVEESILIPRGVAIVDCWPLSLNTVNKVFIKDDFPAPICPITIRLMNWHGSGGGQLFIFLESRSFVLKVKKVHFLKKKISTGWLFLPIYNKILNKHYQSHLFNSLDYNQLDCRCILYVQKRLSSLILYNEVISL